MTDKKLKIGLMGCGAVANYGHIPAIQETEALVLHSVYDPSGERLGRVQQTFGVPHAYDDANDFLTSGIDAVSVTSPAPCHEENVLAAARHALPVLCEKPLAMNRTEASRMIAAMDKAGCSLGGLQDLRKIVRRTAPLCHL